MELDEEENRWPGSIGECWQTKCAVVGERSTDHGGCLKNVFLSTPASPFCFGFKNISGLQAWLNNVSPSNPKTATRTKKNGIRFLSIAHRLGRCWRVSDLMTSRIVMLLRLAGFVPAK